ncbi:MAG TPA: DUF3095 domain-containing protein [Pseudolabrys sp.]|nr:DUF3095 domain-containing protein [Pseudolabrys sp.]
MNPPASTSDFYGRLAVFRDFTQVADEACFRPLPGDWVVGVADVKQSTKAIRENRYKAVNMAGAAVIASVANALKGRDFPFVFGGDGASFAVPSEDAALARQALAETATWVAEDLDLALRVGMVSVADIRVHGRDVRVARYMPSDNVSIAMFSGGGMAWADAAMKRGEIGVPQAPSGSHPDLSGLSCRYELIPSQRGQVLSLVVTPGPRASPDDFRAVVEAVTRIVEKTPDASRPLPGQGLRLKWPPQGYDLEARASRRAGESVRARKAKVLAMTLLYFLIMRSGLRIGRFIPAKYTQELIENSDFRKFDDSLRMVLDCTPELAAEIEDYLKEASARGLVRYGVHRQDAAMMTCFTPSPVNPNHVHFIDGAQGGYALAAAALKEG